MLSTFKMAAFGHFRSWPVLLVWCFSIRHVVLNCVQRSSRCIEICLSSSYLYFHYCRHCYLGISCNFTIRYKRAVLETIPDGKSMKFWLNGKTSCIFHFLTTLLCLWSIRRLLIPQDDQLENWWLHPPRWLFWADPLCYGSRGSHLSTVDQLFTINCLKVVNKRPISVRFRLTWCLLKRPGLIPPTSK